jgi:hypothetical protein
MSAVRSVSIAITGIATLFVTGCPHPATTTTNNTTTSGTQPPLQEFNLPPDATMARVSNGQDIVYVQTDQANDGFDFYLAKPGEVLADHQLVASVPASDFGFAPGQQLVLPETISFSDNLQSGVVGFSSGSYFLDANAQTTAQVIGSYNVSPITAWGRPVFRPAITAQGNRFAFEANGGVVGFLDTRAFVGGNPNAVSVGAGVNPFWYRQDLGFASPDFSQYFVNNLAAATVSSFAVTTSNQFINMTPFNRFEAGLTPYGIRNFGAYVGTSPLVYH